MPPQRPARPLPATGLPATGPPAVEPPAVEPPAVEPVRRLRVTAGMIGLAGFSSLLGLVRDQSIARFFGTSAQTDAFLVAWTVPEAVGPLLMDGALILLLVPVFARALAGSGSIQPAVRSTLATFCVALLGLTALVAGAAPVLVHGFAPGLADPALAVRCLRVTASTVLTLGLAGYLIAALRTTGQYLVTAMSYVGFNVGILALVFGLHRSAAVYSAALGVGLGGALTVVVQLGPFLRRTSLRGLRLLPPAAVRVALAGILPVATYMVARHAQIFVERYYGSELRPGAISALNYAEKIGQIPMQAATMLAAVSFPLLARQAAAGRAGEVRRGSERELRMAMYVIAPAVGLFVALSPQVVELLFRHGAFGGREVAVTAAALRAYSLGLPGQTLVVVGAVCLTSLAPSGGGPGRWSLARAAGLGLAITVLADVSLVRPLGITGLALGNSAGITVTAVVIVVALRRRLPGFDTGGLVGCAVRCAAAVAVGTAAGLASGRLPLPAGAAVPLGGLAVGAGYLLASRLLGVDEARQTVALARTVLARAGRTPAGRPGSTGRADLVEARRGE